MANEAKSTKRIRSMPTTRFERMARRPGGVAREQALASAQAHIDDLKSEFVDWLNRELQELSAALSPSRATIPAIRRRSTRLS